MLFCFGWDIGIRILASRRRSVRLGSDAPQAPHSLPSPFESLFYLRKQKQHSSGCCFVLYRAAEKDIAFKSGRHYRIPAIFRFATQPAPTLSMTEIILAVYFFNLRLIPYIPTMPFQKTILCYNSIGSRRRLTILVLAEVQLWK